MKSSSRIENRRLLVFSHVCLNGPVSARDVARDVLGGCGGVRTSSRAAAYTDLRVLMGRGLVLRRPFEFKPGVHGFLYERAEAQVPR